MSTEALTKVISRSISDAMFRRQLAQNPDGAVRGYDLTAEELAALRANDTTRLAAFGVDQRMSKAFALGQSDATLSADTSSDLNISGAVQAPDAADRNAFESATTGGVQSPDAIARNAFEASAGAVQGPDAADRNAFESATTGGVQSPDAIARNAFDLSADAVQSPDALDRNMDSLLAGVSEPRDIEPTDLGGTSVSELGGPELEH
ncbi:MAG TPA: Os1348 family NHLP clan protein [Candidatus Limnocylindria bacterium]